MDQSAYHKEILKQVKSALEDAENVSINIDQSSDTPKSDQKVGFAGGGSDKKFSVLQTLKLEIVGKIK